MLGIETTRPPFTFLVAHANIEAKFAGPAASFPVLSRLYVECAEVLRFNRIVANSAKSLKVGDLGCLGLLTIVAVMNHPRGM